jgi:hypothetical protein
VYKRQILDRRDAIKEGGFQVTESYPGMTISLPGINVWVSEYKVIVKIRTERGGFKIDWAKVHKFTKFLESKTPRRLTNGNLQRQWADNDELDECLDEILAATKNLVSEVPSAPCRVRSKSKLPPPHKFLDGDYTTHQYTTSGRRDEWITSKVILHRCRVTDVVTIANNLNLVPATQPGTTPWFLITAITMTKGALKFISDGENYYAVTRRSGKVRADWFNPLSVHDQKMVKAAMKLFVSKMEETK